MHQDASKHHHPPQNTAAYPRELEHSATLLSEPQISQQMFIMKITGNKLIRYVAKMQIFKILQQAVLKVTLGVQAV